MTQAKTDIKPHKFDSFTADVLSAFSEILPKNESEVWDMLFVYGSLIERCASKTRLDEPLNFDEAVASVEAAKSHRRDSIKAKNKDTEYNPIPADQYAAEIEFLNMLRAKLVSIAN